MAADKKFKCKWGSTTVEVIAQSVAHAVKAAKAQTGVKGDFQCR